MGFERVDETARAGAQQRVYGRGGGGGGGSGVCNACGAPSGDGRKIRRKKIPTLCVSMRVTPLSDPIIF